MFRNAQKPIIGRLDLELLAGFLAVVDCGSVKEAAERLHLSQSGVSMQLKRLEERVGSPLIRRRGRHLELTEQGRTLLRYARPIVELTEKARSELSTTLLSGPIRVGLPEWIAGAGLERVLARFKRAHPAVRLQVRADAGWELRAALQRGELDLVLAILDECDGADVPVVHAEPLVWVVGDDALLEVETEMPLALFEDPCPFRDLVTAHLERSGWQGVEVFTSRSVASIQAAVEAGLGISILPHSAVRPGLRVLEPRDGFPALPPTRLGLFRAPDVRADVADCLCAELRAALTPDRQA